MPSKILKGSLEKKPQHYPVGRLFRKKCDNDNIHSQDESELHQHVVTADNTSFLEGSGDGDMHGLINITTNLS